MILTRDLLRKCRYMALAACFMVSSQVFGQVPARTVDCSLIYDEYDSLMAAGYLQTPDNFIAGYRGWLSQPAFDSLQRGKFKLHAERGDTGVIVFRTNQNRHGKLLYYWTDPLVDGRRYLVISEAAWYARVADGAGLELFGKLRANSGLGVDLDHMVLVDLVQEEDSDQAGEEVSEPVAADTEPPAGESQVEADVPAEVEIPEAEMNQENLLILPGVEEGAGVELMLVEEEEIVLDRTLPVEAADLSVLRDPATGIYYLEAVNGAFLYFPVDSLCGSADPE